MTDPVDQLRTASDAMLRDIDALVALEEEKRRLSPEEPRMLELAAQIRELAARVLAESRSQESLANVVSARSEADPAPAPAIEDTPRSAPAILAAWREAERRLASARPGTPEAEVAAREVAAFREEYRTAYEARERDLDR